MGAAQGGRLTDEDTGCTVNFQVGAVPFEMAIEKFQGSSLSNAKYSGNKLVSGISFQRICTDLTIRVVAVLLSGSLARQSTPNNCVTMISPLHETMQRQKGELVILPAICFQLA